MPNLQQHNDKYEKNIKFINIEKLEREHREWFVTGVFYTVLHLIEGYLFIFKHENTTNHVERLNIIRKDSILNTILVPYKNIYEQSLRARYYECEFSDEDIIELKNDYDDIEKRIKPMLMQHIQKSRSRKAN